MDNTLDTAYGAKDLLSSRQYRGERLYWLNEKQAIPRRYDNENRRTKRTQSRAGVSG